MLIVLALLLATLAWFLARPETGSPPAPRQDDPVTLPQPGARAA